MGNRIAVIDYGMGNLHSIQKALEYIGGEVLVTGNPADLPDADRVVLPGIGAFGDGMANLRKSGFVNALRNEIIENKKPFLVICLGMQLLADKSYEFGEHEGLGFVPGEVKKFDFLDNSEKLPVPHVGWNSLHFRTTHPILEGVRDGSHFYFVHSFHFVPQGENSLIGMSNYGYDFPAAIGYENIFATQFHPEKSQNDGLKILKNFISWRPT